VIVVVAEKPSVARDIARVLGATGRREGYFEGKRHKVTWAVGHLVGLAEPRDIDARWARWDARELPMLPSSFPLTVRSGLDAQFRVVSRLMNAKSTAEVICATDAGREGELIFRFIYEAAECKKPVRRLWVSSLTPDALQAGFRMLKPGSAYDALAAAARTRAICDWLVGMNLSRAYSIRAGKALSVGRVKTPTLAMVVSRELAVEKFVPVPYREVVGRFRVDEGEFEATYARRGFDEHGKIAWISRLPAGTDAQELAWDEDADAVVARARVGVASLEEVEQQHHVTRPPLFFDLAELQRAANRLWGWTASHTLAVAQELYEKHKALSYPRTDSRHLSVPVAATLAGVVARIREPYAEMLAPGTGITALSRRFVDDAKVTDHHAIIPTGIVPVGVGADGQSLYDLVCRRLLSAWQPDAVDAVTDVTVVVTHAEGTDRYAARCKVSVAVGWRCLDLRDPEQAGEEPFRPGGLRAGRGCELADAGSLLKETAPPKRFTEATLLSAMERAGAGLQAELSDAMKDRGLGTPATRAAVIDDLVKRDYMVREGKALKPTLLGMDLIRVVHTHVASPAMTGEWEAALRLIERSRLAPDDVIGDVQKFVAAVVEVALA
jgi:DNA topoisomerase-3